MSSHRYIHCIEFAFTIDMRGNRDGLSCLHVVLTKLKPRVVSIIRRFVCACYQDLDINARRVRIWIWSHNYRVVCIPQDSGRQNNKGFEFRSMLDVELIDNLFNSRRGHKDAAD